MQIKEHAPVRNGNYDRDSHDGCDICGARVCSKCGEPIEACRRWLGCQTCAACATHKGVIRP